MRVINNKILVSLLVLFIILSAKSSEKEQTKPSIIKEQYKYMPSRFWYYKNFKSKNSVKESKEGKSSKIFYPINPLNKVGKEDAPITLYPINAIPEDRWNERVNKWNVLPDKQSIVPRQMQNNSSNKIKTYKSNLSSKKLLLSPNNAISPLNNRNSVRKNYSSPSSNNTRLTPKIHMFRPRHSR